MRPSAGHNRSKASKLHADGMLCTKSVVRLPALCGKPGQASVSMFVSSCEPAPRLMSGLAAATPKLARGLVGGEWCAHIYPSVSWRRVLQCAWLCAASVPGPQRHLEESWLRNDEPENCPPRTKIGRRLGAGGASRALRASPWWLGTQEPEAGREKLEQRVQVARHVAHCRNRTEPETNP